VRNDINDTYATSSADVILASADKGQDSGDKGAVNLTHIDGRIPDGVTLVRGLTADVLLGTSRFPTLRQCLIWTEQHPCIDLGQLQNYSGSQQDNEVFRHPSRLPLRTSRRRNTIDRGVTSLR